MRSKRPPDGQDIRSGDLIPAKNPTHDFMRIENGAGIFREHAQRRTAQIPPPLT
jgi:hypothetical protein